ncbi:MAG: DUF5606 domain-containing protein [Chitinophagaceae bacterium]
MEYSRIVAVTGMPGLYEMVSSKSDGALVRSLEDKATKFVSSRVHNLSHLESIEIYTQRDNVNLVEVFEAMKAKGDALPDVKDNKALKSYFESVYPDMDFERVYASDMKKIVKWFEVLEGAGIEYKLTEQGEEEEETEAVAAEAPAAEEAEAPAKKAPAKKAAAKKTAAKKEEAKAEPKAKKESKGEEEGKAAPKKAASKKKSDDA